MPDREFLEGSERAKGVTMNKRPYRRSRIPERETLVDQLCINGKERRESLFTIAGRRQKSFAPLKIKYCFNIIESRISANAAKKYSPKTYFFSQNSIGRSEIRWLGHRSLCHVNESVF